MFIPIDIRRAANNISETVNLPVFSSRICAFNCKIAHEPMVICVHTQIIKFKASLLHQDKTFPEDSAVTRSDSHSLSTNQRTSCWWF